MNVILDDICSRARHNVLSTEKEAGAIMKSETNNAPPYTKKQGQYLAFIYYYTKIHGRPPAERDMQMYFRTTPPAVHSMIKKLHEHGLIERTPGKARSIRVLLPREQLPDLD